jgi:hypothetical protein
MINPHEHPEGFLAILAGIGATVGLGKLLASEEQLTARKVIGRALVHGGFGCTAGAIGLLFPSADPIMMFGVAAGFASLGNSAIELLFQHYFPAKKDETKNG